jgi:hypothetical protein
MFRLLRQSQQSASEGTKEKKSQILLVPAGKNNIARVSGKYKHYQAST